MGVHARALDQAALTTAVVLVHQAHHHHLPRIRALYAALGLQALYIAIAIC